MRGEVTLKPVSQFKLIGRPAKRVDTTAKVNGTARFGIDAMVEGMRVAAIAMCPTIGGRLRSLDERASPALPRPLGGHAGPSRSSPGAPLHFLPPTRAQPP